MSTAEKIIVALDTSAEDARELAQTLAGTASWVKVGMTLYYHAGPGIVAELKEMGYHVFVDLKLHDIPHQVRGAARSVVEAGADMLTVHASGGMAMMQAACAGAEEGAHARAAQGVRGEAICLAVTVLTSLDDEVLHRIGVEGTASQQVERLALLAQEAGMDGIVCSPQESRLVRQKLGTAFTIVTPGVRPTGSASGDQARVATPTEALRDGADHVVIGRPITEAADPRAAFDTIVEGIAL